MGSSHASVDKAKGLLESCSENPSSRGLKSYLIPQAFNALDRSSHSGETGSLVEVVLPEILVGGALTKQVIDDDQDGVGHGNGGTLSTSARCQPMILG